MPTRDCWFQKDCKSPWQRGTWHGWSTDHVDFCEHGCGPYPCVIVEDIAGGVHVLRANLVHFGQPDRLTDDEAVNLAKLAAGAVGPRQVDLGSGAMHADPKSFRAVAAPISSASMASKYQPSAVDDAIDLDAPPLTIEDRAFMSSTDLHFDEQCDNNDGRSCKAVGPEPGDLVEPHAFDRGDTLSKLNAELVAESTSPGCEGKHVFSTLERRGAPCIQCRQPVCGKPFDRTSWRTIFCSLSADHIGPCENRHSLDYGSPGVQMSYAERIAREPYSASKREPFPEAGV